MLTARRRPFGALPDGTAVEELTLRGGALSCGVLTYGGAIRSLTVPSRSGSVDVVLGFDTLEDYRAQDKYLGALIGRYANRIAGSSFPLEGQTWPIAPNEGGVNHLHGGTVGFDKQVWAVESLTENALTLSLHSPDGQEGYPGNLTAQVTYTLKDGALELDYLARSDRPTLCNLTNHAYFNLSGHNSGPVSEQQIQLFAGRYTPVGAGSIPTGELASVEGTPMDLRTPTPIGAHADAPFGQLRLTGGYDHNWVLDGWDGSLRPAARAWSPATGVTLEVWTTLPGLQFYSGNSLDGCPAGKGGAPYARRWGFCLETQFFPDSPHRPEFPSSVLAAGAEYRSTTVYRFGVSERPAEFIQKEGIL